MDNGYVYILSNPAMPGLLKIGRTVRSSEERARELSRSTSMPARFAVEYEVWSPQSSELERAVHARLAPLRHNTNREFFAAAPLEVIPIVRTLAEELRLKCESLTVGNNEASERYEAIDVLGRLRMLYGPMIRTEVVSARIYQTRLRCYLETVEEEIFPNYEPIPLVDQTITRKDLGFICNGDPDEMTFSPRNTVAENARIFLEEFDAYSKLVCCTELFTDEAGRVIQDDHFAARKAPSSDAKSG